MSEEDEGVFDHDGQNYYTTYLEGLRRNDDRVPMHIVNTMTARSLCGIKKPWYFDGASPVPTCQRCRKIAQDKQMGPYTPR